MEQTILSLQALYFCLARIDVTRMSNCYGSIMEHAGISSTLSLGGKGLGFHSMPFSMTETINLMIR